MTKPYNILGVDPGFDRLGLAVICKDGSREQIIWSECFIPPHRGELDKRLAAIWQELKRVFSEHAINAVAIETVFAENNVTTVIGVAQVIGMVRAQAFEQGLPIHTFTPLQIKAAMTGNGRATKAEMDKMIRLLVDLNSKKMLDDEMDAIAVALTCSAHLKTTLPV